MTKWVAPRGLPLTMAALICLGVAGCGDGRPERAPVTGTVLIDGEPVTTGFIRFISSVGRASVSPIGPDGKFQLSCFDENDGAILGTHRVEVIANKLFGDDKIQWFVPKKYARYTTSGLEYEIAQEEDNLEIKLTWDGGKPYFEKQ